MLVGPSHWTKVVTSMKHRRWCHPCRRQLVLHRGSSTNFNNRLKQLGTLWINRKRFMWQDIERESCTSARWRSWTTRHMHGAPSAGGAMASPISYDYQKPTSAHRLIYCAWLHWVKKAVIPLANHLPITWVLRGTKTDHPEPPQATKVRQEDLEWMERRPAPV